MSFPVLSGSSLTIVSTQRYNNMNICSQHMADTVPLQLNKSHASHRNYARSDLFEIHIEVDTLDFLFSP